MPMEIELIPITMFVVIGLIAIVFFYFRFRARRELQHTLRAAIDKGMELTPEVLDRLGDPKPSGNADMRRGVIAIAIGVACAAFGLLVGDADAIGPFLGIGAFPFLVGIAYLGLWNFRER